jgi:predicted dehydrogenase
VESPAALTTEDAWRLVEASEKSGAQCMMLENMSFRKDNLAVLNMKRLGFFGDIVHCEGSFSDEWVDFWFFDAKNGEPNWAVDYLKKYNRDQFPGPAVGPLLGWMDINRGDVITEIYSTATEPKGINAFFRREFGTGFPQGNLKYTQGDIVTSIMKTQMGKTLVINTSLQLPVPETKYWKLQGINGIYDKEKNSVHLASKTPGYHRWEPFEPYQQKYNHKWWTTDYSSGFNEGADFVMLDQFIKAIRSKTPTPFDVYDSAVMSAIVELSGISIETGAPVPFPDFTRGKWQTRKILFGVEE